MSMGFCWSFVHTSLSNGNSGLVTSHSNNTLEGLDICPNFRFCIISPVSISNSCSTDKSMEDLLDYPDIHVAPQGFEVERIYKPANTRGIRELYLLYPHSIDNRKQNECISKVKENLDDSITVKETDCDIFDFEKSLQGILDVIEQNEEARIEVNLATGSKITAITGLLACMKTEAEPFYVRGKNYGDTVCEAKSDEPIAIPSLELSRPSGDELILMQYLYDNGETTPNKLSNELGDQLEDHSPKKIQQTLSNRAEEGYINMIPHKGAKLTDRGDKLMKSLDMLGDL